MQINLKMKCSIIGIPMTYTYTINKLYCSNVKYVILNYAKIFWLLTINYNTICSKFLMAK